jgi:hypothetical protein
MQTESSWKMGNVQLNMLVSYKVDLIIISFKINLFSAWYGWKIDGLASVM